MRQLDIQTCILNVATLRPSVSLLIQIFHSCPLKISGDVCRLLKYRVLERKIDDDDLN